MTCSGGRLTPNTWPALLGGTPHPVYHLTGLPGTTLGLLAGDCSVLPTGTLFQTLGVEGLPLPVVVPPVRVATLGHGYAGVTAQQVAFVTLAALRTGLATCREACTGGRAAWGTEAIVAVGWTGENCRTRKRVEL